MSDDRGKYDKLPIPTYEEATSSRPQSAQSNRPPSDLDHDAERQGLLGNGRPRGGLGGASWTSHNYRPPTVGSERSSCDSDFTTPEVMSDEDEDDAELRRDMEEMEMTDPEDERRAQQRERLRQNLTKRFVSITESFSRLPFPRLNFRFPSFTSLRSWRPSLPSSASELRSESRIKISWPILARIVAVITIAALVYIFVILKLFPGRNAAIGQQFIPESVKSFLQGAVDRGRIETYLRQVSYDDHIAGTKGDFFLVKYIEEHFKSAKLDSVYTEDFHVYVNYAKPDGRRVAIIDPPDQLWQATLQEDPVDDNTMRHQAPIYHGFSRSGNVTGPLVYANYGSRTDFDFLAKKKIDVKGSVVLVRHFGSEGDPALKVKTAELAGAKGCLIFSDPAEDGFKRGSQWPEGPFRTADSVQRSSVSLLSWILGDLQTPGWSSNANKKLDPLSKDINANPALVNIPSLPLAWRDADILLRAIQGKGVEAPKDWSGGIPNLKYFTGASDESPTVQLMNLQDEANAQPVRNVIGRIEGTEAPEKEVYIGNHRDAWCFGAVDPGSGTATLLELVHVFSELMGMGWRPRRTIVFASWDAGEFNMIGSTEHVEDRIEALRMHGVAYLNVAVGVAGHSFRADASPVFARPLKRVLDRVADPTGNVTLAQRWEEKGSTLGTLGTSSDYVPFQSLAGMSSLDMGFGSDEPDKPPAFPRHSCYDSFTWMQSIGDAGLFYHTALAQVWALLALEIADAAILGFDMESYANAIAQHFDALKKDIASVDKRPDTPFLKEIRSHSASKDPLLSKQTWRNGKPIDMSALEEAIKLLTGNAATFMAQEDAWHQAMLSANPSSARTFPSSTAGEPDDLSIMRASRNARMSEFEYHLLDLPLEGIMGVIADSNRGKDSSQKRRKRRKRDEKDVPHSKEGGIPSRPQFKHVIFGPPGWSSSDIAQSGENEVRWFPGVRDALARRDWDGVQEQVKVLGDTIKMAADALGV